MFSLRMLRNRCLCTLFLTCDSCTVSQLTVIAKSCFNLPSTQLKVTWPTTAPRDGFLAVTYMFMYDITMFSGHVFECPTSFSVISQPTSFHGPAVLCHTAIDECLIQVLSFWAFATSKLGYPLLQCLRAFRFSSVFHSADRVFVIIERNWNGSAEQCWRKSSNYKTRHL